MITKNYTEDSAVCLCSDEIRKLKDERQYLKAELNTVKKSTSLGNFNTAKQAEYDLLLGLQDTKEKILAWRQLNKRYVKELNGGVLPSYQANQTKSDDDRFVDFNLSRDDVVNLMSSLNEWLTKSRGTKYAEKMKLSIVRSKLV